MTRFAASLFMIYRENPRKKSNVVKIRKLLYEVVVFLPYFYFNENIYILSHLSICISNWITALPEMVCFHAENCTQAAQNGR
jgi:hypothetical protein